VHGEPDQQLAFAAAIRERYGVEVIVPERGRSFDL
jgi:predicted metal-dependent RNase